MNDPIRKTVTVPLSTQDAFALFTAQFDTWWPKASHAVKGATSRLSFPKHKGEPITETAEGGEIVIWGKLIANDPGKYLAFTWFPGRDESQATVVEVSFSQTEAGTRCDLTHGGFDILGPTADAVSSSYLQGWDLVLGCYRAAAKVPTPA